MDLHEQNTKLLSEYDTIQEEVESLTARLKTLEQQQRVIRKQYDVNNKTLVHAELKKAVGTIQPGDAFLNGQYLIVFDSLGTTVEFNIYHPDTKACGLNHSNNILYNNVKYYHSLGGYGRWDNIHVDDFLGDGVPLSEYIRIGRSQNGIIVR